MKRYLGIFILTVVVGLSGCASDTDSDTQVSSRAYSMQMQQNQNRVQTFNGRRQIRSSDGSMWTPPAGRSDLQYPDYHTSCKSECNRSCTYHFWYRFW